VLACNGDGCSVRLVETGRVMRAAFSPLVRDHVRIRRRQLVALDTSSGPPEIIWRWFIGKVEAMEPDGIAVRRLDQPPGSCRVVSNPPAGTAPPVGAEVYYGHTEDWEVVDVVRNDRPTDPARIATEYFPYIEARLRR
jgi:hypothetical protein